MKLGLDGKTAIVCASSKGLGKSCAKALAAEGVNVVLNGRTQSSLDTAAEEIAKIASGKVTQVCCDVTTEDGRNALLEVAPHPDIVVNNAGGPPPGNFRDWDVAAWHSAINANMLTPIELIRATVDGMIERGFGRIVNITSSAVKAPIPELGLSNGARAGLTGFVAGTARQVAGNNVTINNILPGRFMTDRLHGNITHNAEQANVSFDEMASQMQKKIPAGRFGDPDEFGALCAYLCGQHAGYITGQNFVIDGGAYPGTL
ncbi:MAG: SDR family oxidoreductase [Arenicellales bacterium WSBS_2016_MAG_OTU3]